MDSLFEHFEDIKIHVTVFNELDDQRKQYIHEYVGKNVQTNPQSESDCG